MPKTTDSKNRFLFDGVALPPWGITTGPLKVRVHPPTKCAGQHCCVHNPSDHHMVDWPLNFRADRGMSERICPHGVGHPDPDDLGFRSGKDRDVTAVHGCDSCCIPPEKKEE